MPPPRPERRSAGAWQALACAVAWSTAQLAAAAPEPSAVPGPSLVPCRAEGIRHEVRCGVVRVPLDAARADGRRIDVRFLVVPALSQHKRADPVFIVAGGPGQSAVALAGPVLGQFERLNTRRDIVFVDQRGTGGSSPLQCDESDGDAFSDQADSGRQVALAMRCLAALKRLPALRDASDSGEALRHYATPDAVRDLDAVRAALGADRIDLYGASYGTRVVLDYLRQFPAHVRRSVLDGVAPADMALPRSLSVDNQQALDRLFDACMQDPACRRDHPALRAHWSALLAALPTEVTVDDPVTGVPRTFLLRRDALLSAVRASLYAPAYAAALPQAIDEAAAGRWRAIVALSGLVRPHRQDALALGMHFAVVCTEDAPLLDRPPPTPIDGRPGADFGDSAAQLYRRICAEWPRGTLPAAFTTIPTSASPVWLLSGGLDPATPPRHGARVAAALGANARHTVVANAGHGLLGLACLRDALFRFVDAPTDGAALAVETDCASAVPRPPAFQPTDAAR